VGWGWVCLNGAALQQCAAAPVSPLTTPPRQPPNHHHHRQQQEPLANHIGDYLHSGLVEYAYFVGQRRYRDLFRTTSQWWAYNDCATRFATRHRCACAHACADACADVRGCLRAVVYEGGGGGVLIFFRCPCRELCGWRLKPRQLSPHPPNPTPNPPTPPAQAQVVGVHRRR